MINKNINLINGSTMIKAILIISTLSLTMGCVETVAVDKNSLEELYSNLRTDLDSLSKYTYNKDRAEELIKEYKSLDNLFLDIVYTRTGTIAISGRTYIQKGNALIAEVEEYTLDEFEKDVLLPLYREKYKKRKDND